VTAANHKEDAMVHYIREEPVLCQALVQAALTLLVAFGTHLSTSQVGAIVAFSAAFLSVLTRTQVTPVANPKVTNGSTLLTGTAAAGH
jgi:hypothetical protein